MRPYHDGVHLFPREMLFNIDADPHEQQNVADQHPDVVREAAYRLLNWHDQMMLSMPYPYTVDPMWTVMREGGPYHCREIGPRYIEHLRKTGRGHHADFLEANPTGLRG